MTDSKKQQHKNQALHELMEGEFQALVDIIEQKQIVHEDIKFRPSTEVDPITQAAKQLQQQSLALGASTLAEFFSELESSARDGLLGETRQLLENIRDEFETINNILSKD